MPTMADIQHEIGNVLAVSEELEHLDREPQALEYLNELALQEADKVDGISYAVRKRKHEIEWLKSEEQRLKRLRQAMERRLESFRNYLLALMQYHGLRALKGHAGSLSLREVQSVIVTDIDALPGEYKDVVIEERPRKRELREVLVNGEGVDGAQLFTKTTLTIR
ncbi:MAG: siphovirus Gp157 family protein [Oceanidesulfovibrio sp.]